MLKVLAATGLLFVSSMSSAVQVYAPVRHHNYDQAFQIGRDTNGAPLYLCMAELFGRVQQGKTWPGYNHCNIAYHGREYLVSNYNLAPRRVYQHASWQNEPRQAIVVSRNDRHPIYLCQAKFRGSMQPGKTWPGYNHCNISYAGKEIRVDNFVILGAPHATSSNTHYHGNSDRGPRVVIQR